MDGFITRAQLRSYSLGISVANESVASIQLRCGTKTAAEADITLFVSHSHKDKDLIGPTVDFLKSHGVKLYVDWMDEGMPDVVSGETAKKLKDKISSLKKFLVVVTENSKDSRWVPWELGIADSSKGMDHIAALPVAESDRSFTHNEYLQIYPRIEYYQNRWIVWRADPPSLINLVDWLRTK